MILIISIFAVLGFQQIIEQKPDKEQRIEASKLFNQKYDGKFEIQMNSTTGTPSSIFRYKITKYSGTPEQIAKAFLNEEKTMLGIENTDKDLELIRTNYSKKGGTRLMYTQKYKDIPVLNSGYLVAVGNDGAIYYVSGDYFPDMNIDIRPTISNEQVVNEIRTDLAGYNIKIIKEPVICIYIANRYKDSMSYNLAYNVRVKLNEKNEVGSFDYIIDAQTGKIISKTNLLKGITGYGTVYQTSPAHNNTSTESLYRLNVNNPLILDGSNVIVYNDKEEEAEEESEGYFIYNPSDTHFDEVMAYYHCDEFEAWLCDKFDLWGPPDIVDQVTVYTHNLHTDQGIEIYSGTHPDEYTIYLADSGTSANNFPGLRDPVKDSDCITHEYMHIVNYTYNSSFLTGDFHACAVDEAYADYFSVAYKNWRGVSSDTTGEYVRQFKNPNYERTLDNPYATAYYDIMYYPNCDFHSASQVISGAFWDLRRDIPSNDEDVIANDIDELVFESLGSLDQNPTRFEIRTAMEALAYAWNWYCYIDDIETAFYYHGIGDLPVPSVEIDGPEGFWNYSYGEWEASAYGGYLPYNFNWYVRKLPLNEVEERIYAGDGENITLNLDDLFDLFGDGVDVFELTVEVSDGINSTDSDSKTVTIWSNKKGVEQIPKDYALDQNYPNPFNPVTTIKFALPKSSPVKLVIYDITGREVAVLVNGSLPAGYHSVQWDARNVPSGMYIYRITAGSFTQTKRMMVIK